MNISYNWLKELTATQLNPRELAEVLTRIGLAVEVVHEAGDDFGLEIDLTSNRPDCLSHLGVAREITAGSDGHGGFSGKGSSRTEGSAESLSGVAERHAD